jgi:hypothetical protein
MRNDLKLRVRIQDQQMTLWEIVKKADTYLMFRASITSGKKNPDGTWDNVSQNFTCFANGDAIKKISDGFVQKAKIKVTGSLTFLPEKRSAMGKNGEYQESIFSNATINVEAVEFVEVENFAGNFEKNDTSYSSIDDDIPF